MSTPFCGRLLAIVVILWSVVPAHALEQDVSPTQYTRRSWTNNEGLRGSQVWAIAQDHAGYLWLGTNEGLVRFDGVRFVPWTAAYQGPMPTSSVRSLCVARDGSLWVAFGGAGAVARLNAGQLETYDDADGVPRGIIYVILEDKEGGIWAAGVGGAARFRDGRWERVTAAEGLPDHSVSAIYEDRRGYMWVGTSLGVFRRTERDKPFQLFSAGLRIQAFSQDRSGSVWGVGDSVLSKLDGDSPVPAIDVNASAGAWRLLYDTNGDVWIATLGEGLLHVTIRGEQTIVEKYKGESALTSDVVRSLLQDREGNIWIGTQSGLNRLSPGAVVSLPQSGDTMSRLVRAITVDANGSTWVGTGDGLYRFSGAGRRRYDRRHGMSSEAVVALHPDVKGGIWVATERGVGYFRNGRFEPVELPPPAKLGRVFAMTTDDDGGLWLGDFDEGLIRLHKGIVESFADAKVHRAPLVGFTDKGGRVWIGFVDGIVMTYEKGKTRYFSEADGLPGGQVTSIHEDSSRSLWFGTSNGLSRFKDGRFESVRWSSGLPGNIVGAIMDDERGDLWLGVSSGIAQLKRGEFDKAVSQANHRIDCVLYGASDGLRGDPIGLGYPTVAKTTDGSLWFVTSDGFAVIDPRTATKNRVPPPVVIESILADQRAVVASTQRLPALISTLQIDYTGLSFAAPEKVTFKYLMEGFDKEWVEAGVRRQAFYTNLPPGAYRFRVAAMNDNVPSVNEAVWQFAINPAFYQTQWFRLLLLTLGMAAATVAWRARVHQVKWRFSLILVERTRMAREIHDTLLQSLVGVLLRLDEVSSILDPSAEQPRDKLGHLRRQVEFYIREARESIRDLRSPALQNKELGAALREAGERMTAATGVLFDFQVSGRARRGSRKLEENLLRIGQEAISNAIRHAAPSKVSVELRYNETSVLLLVSDDGIGFDPGAQDRNRDRHWGVTTMRERADQISGRFDLTSGRGKGSRVEVSAPI